MSTLSTVYDVYGSRWKLSLEVLPMTTDLPDVRCRLRDARNALNFAWTTWSGMKQPLSVTLRARIVVGEEWLMAHTSPEEQALGRDLIAQLRAQAHNEERPSRRPTQAQRPCGVGRCRAPLSGSRSEYTCDWSATPQLRIPEPRDGE